MKTIREVLAPLLTISYVCGLRLWNTESSTGYLRLWFSILYMLLFWSIYCFFLKTVSFVTFDISYSIENVIWSLLDFHITLLSVLFGMYHNMKFSKCLKRLDIIDDTLLKVGITTDYLKLHKKSVWLVLGWFVIVIFVNYGMSLWISIEYNYDILTVMYYLIINHYCFYINMINELIFGSILGYIKLKFDQVNGYLLNLSEDNKIKQPSENPNLLSHQHEFPKAPNNELITWIIIHLHLELHKISFDINSIFGIEMTIKMGYNFLLLAIDLDEMFNIMFINYNFVKYNIKVLYIIATVVWIFIDVLRLFFINYMCETISEKANATGNLINRIPYFTYSVEIRENISQLLLQITQMPVKFYGIGLFQFGYKFLQGFTSSITTVLVLLIQKHNK